MSSIVQAESDAMSIDEQVRDDFLVHKGRTLTFPPLGSERPVAHNGRMREVLVEGRVERISEEHLSYILRRRELVKKLEDTTNDVKVALQRALENARAPLPSVTDAGTSYSRAEPRSLSTSTFGKSRTSTCSRQSVTTSRSPLKPVESVSANRPPKPVESMTTNGPPKPVGSVATNGPLKPVESVTINRPSRPVESATINRPVKQVKFVTTNRSPGPLESASVNQSGPSASLSASSNTTSSSNTPPLSSGSSSSSTSVSKVSPSTPPDDDNDEPIVCGINGCKCILPRLFFKVRDHVRYHHRHGLEMEIPSNPEEYQCPYPTCHFKSPHRMRVAEHCCSSQHLDVPPRCYACGKSFNGRLYALTRHLQEACKKGGRWNGRLKRSAKLERTESDIPLIDVVRNAQRKRKAEEDQETWKSKKKLCKEKPEDEDMMEVNYRKIGHQVRHIVYCRIGPLTSRATYILWAEEKIRNLVPALSIEHVVHAFAAPRIEDRIGKNGTHISTHEGSQDGGAGREVSIQYTWNRVRFRVRIVLVSQRLYEKRGR